MLDILDVLYNYIQENRIAYYLNGDPEYCLAGRRMDEVEEWLEANLPPDFRYERALFRCGLGLGLELAGSGRLPG